MQVFKVKHLKNKKFSLEVYKRERLAENIKQLCEEMKLYIPETLVEKIHTEDLDSMEDRDMKIISVTEQMVSFSGKLGNDIALPCGCLISGARITGNKHCDLHKNVEIETEARLNGEAVLKSSGIVPSVLIKRKKNNTYMVYIASVNEIAFVDELVRIIAKEKMLRTMVHFSSMLKEVGDFVVDFGIYVYEHPCGCIKIEPIMLPEITHLYFFPLLVGSSLHDAFVMYEQESATSYGILRSCDKHRTEGREQECTPLVARKVFEMLRKNSKQFAELGISKEIKQYCLKQI